MEYELWLLEPFSLQFLTKNNEIWPMTARGHFLYSSSSKSWKYDLPMRGAISFTTPYQNHTTAKCIFLYNSLSKSSKYDLWLLGAFPLQFLIKIIKIWPMTAMGNFIKIIETWPMNASGNFLYNSLSKSLKYDLWLLWAISFTIP